MNRLRRRCVRIRNRDAPCVRARREWRARLDDHLLRGLIETHHWALWVMRSLIDFQHVFHIGDEARVGFGAITIAV